MKSKSKTKKNNNIYSNNNSYIDSDNFISSISNSINSNKNDPFEIFRLVGCSSFELLFWKVIKNKYLFNMITANLRETTLTIKYDNYTEINEMVKRNQISLIKYKLQKNHHLDITYNRKISKIALMEIISFEFYKLYEKEKNDQDFYQMFFKRFHHHIIADIESHVIQAIECDNVLVFEMLTQYPFNYQISELVLKRAVYSFAIKSLQLILNINGRFINQSLIYELIESRIKVRSYNSIKLYKFIILLHEEFNYSLVPLSLVKLLFNSKFTKCPFNLNFKLKHLIISCYLISLLLHKYIGSVTVDQVKSWSVDQVIEWLKVINVSEDITQNFKNKEINGKEFLKIYNQITGNSGNGSNDILNELGLTSIGTKLNFQRSIKQLLNHKGGNINGVGDIDIEDNYIKKYFNIIKDKDVEIADIHSKNNKENNLETKDIYSKFILSKQVITSFKFSNEELNLDIHYFTNFNPNVRSLLEMYLSLYQDGVLNSKYFLLYCFQDSPDWYSKFSDLYKIFKLSLEFANIQLFQYYCKKAPNFIFYNWGSLFKYCPDIEKQKEFIKFVLSLLTKNYIHDIKYACITIISIAITQLQDLELFKLIIQDKELTYNIKLAIFKKAVFKTPEILELLYNSKFINIDESIHIFKEIELIKKYIQLEEDPTKSILRSLNYSYRISPVVAKLVLDNPDYFSETFLFKIKNEGGFEINSREAIDAMKYLKDVHKIILDNFNYNYQLNSNNYYHLLYIEYFSNNITRSNANRNGNGKDSYSNLYFMGKLNDSSVVLSVPEIVSNFDLLLDIVLKRNDVSFVMRLIDCLISFDDRIMDLVSKVVLYNRLQILLAIHSKYPQIFQYSFRRKDQTLGFHFLKNLMVLALINDHIDIWNFFMNPNNDNKPMIPFSPSLFREKSQLQGKKTLIYNLYKDQFLVNQNSKNIQRNRNRYSESESESESEDDSEGENNKKRKQPASSSKSRSKLMKLEKNQ